MPSLKVPIQVARSRLYLVSHSAFQKAIENNWKVDPNGHVLAQSVCWLFCWAKTGMNSDDARETTRQIFDEILDVPFDEFDRKVDHKWARRARSATGNIESQLSRLLGQPIDAYGHSTSGRDDYIRATKTVTTRPQHATAQKESDSYVDATRLHELQSLGLGQYDLSRLIELCNELNVCYSSACYVATAMLVRALLDHVPPIFGLKTFAEVSNNYGGSRSFRESMEHLQNSCRIIADRHLHVQIRGKEALPTRTQVDFRADVDVLLEEIVRILK
jgi:hypothetical protein